jgi:hypothetical protein
MFAFIIPIHPPHYNFIYNFIDKNNTNIDIYLIFSNEDDYNIFTKKDKIKKIIIPQINTNNIVTYKKFFALEKLKDEIKYDYFIVCDAEISIIPENFNETNILKKINNIYENKMIYAGKVSNPNIINITKTSTSLFSDWSKLKEITENFTLYFWWSDLPVYKREHLTHFFSLIDYTNINVLHFDHTIYSAYLILYHNFIIVNITSMLNHHWSLELYNTENINNLNILKSLKYSFSYITKTLYNNHIDYLKNEGSFLLYHLDR